MGRLKISRLPKHYLSMRKLQSLLVYLDVTQKVLFWSSDTRHIVVGTIGVARRLKEMQN